MGTTKTVEQSSGFSLVTPSDLSSSTKMAAGSILSVTSTNTIDQEDVATTFPTQQDVSDVQGSVDFVDATDQVFTNLTNPAAVVGLSTGAPEIIAAIDYVPLFSGAEEQSGSDTVDICNEGVYNAIYQNVLLDSLTREAARNCLVKMLANENGEVEQAISGLTNITIDSYSSFLTAISQIASYSFFVRNVLNDDTMFDAKENLKDVFEAIRAAMDARFSIDVTTPEIEWLGSTQEASILNFQGFNPKRITGVDHLSEIMTEYIWFSEDEYKNSSNTKIIAQIIHDLRKFILYGSNLSDLSQERDTSEAGFSPYEIFDDASEGNFSSVINGLTSLNNNSVTLTSAAVGVLSYDDYSLFLDGLSGLSYVDRMTILSQIISRDVSMSFLKRTSIILNQANEMLDSDLLTPGLSNPSLVSLIDQTVGSIGGSLFESSPASESLASLINPKTSDGNRILTFEKFSVDSSFGDAISGFDAFAGDIVEELKNATAGSTPVDTEDFNYIKFVEDFRSKATQIARFVPVLIGGAGSSNNFFRGIGTVISEYLAVSGFIYSDSIIGSYLTDGKPDAYSLPDPADELEFIRLGIFELAGKNAEIAHLLLQFLDIRRLMKKMVDIPEAVFNTSGDEITGGTSAEESFMETIQESYSEFYDIAESLTKKILTETPNDSGRGGLSAFDPGNYDVDSRIYRSIRTIKLEVSNILEDFSEVFQNPDDHADVMKTPIGLALMTSPTENCIFDLPQRVLDVFYEDFIEKDIAGISLQDNDIIQINRAVSPTVTVATSAGETTGAETADTLSGAEIITDFRGFSDTLRRRVIAHIMFDIFSHHEIGASRGLITDLAADNLDVSPVAQREQGLMGLGESRAGSTSFIQNGWVDITAKTFISLDIARTTQLGISLSKYSLDGTFSRASSGAIEDFDSMVSDIFGDAYDSSIETNTKSIHSGLIKEYSRVETLTETLNFIGDRLDESAAGITTSFTDSETLDEFFRYVSLSAANAVANGDVPGLTEDDAISAIFSTCMSNEVFFLQKSLIPGSSYVSAPGFFDDDISSDGVQASSTDLLIPSCECIPANLLSQRIIPSLQYLTAPGREQSTDDNLKQDPIQATGDPDDDRMKILAIGLPIGLTERLRQEAESFASSDEVGNYALSPLINMKVYKKDLDRGDVVYKPKNFVFDVLANSVAREFGGDVQDVTSQIPTTAGVDSLISNVENITDYPLSAFGDVNIGTVLSEVSTVPLKGAGVDEYSAISESGWYPGVDFWARKPSRGQELFFASHQHLTGDLDEIFSDSASEIKMNLMKDLILKEYLKITAGIDVRERAFQLFTVGTSHAETEDGGGLGTKSADYEFLKNASANSSYVANDGMEAVFTSDDIIQQARSDVLAIISQAIDNNIIGSFDLETAVSSNIVSKISQSFLFSSEKYFNQVHLPPLFERIFCILVDPDGFDIDTQESAQFIHEGGSSTYVSELFNFFVTVEILPDHPDQSSIYNL